MTYSFVVLVLSLFLWALVSQGQETCDQLTESTPCCNTTGCAFSACFNSTSSRDYKCRNSTESKTDCVETFDDKCVGAIQTSTNGQQTTQPGTTPGVPNTTQNGNQSTTTQNGTPTPTPNQPTTSSNVTDHPSEKPTSQPAHVTTDPSTTSSPVVIPTSTAMPTTTQPGAHFDAGSFIGGIVLASGLFLIVIFAWKFFKSRSDKNYHTL